MIKLAPTAPLKYPGLTSILLGTTDTAMLMVTGGAIVKHTWWLAVAAAAVSGFARAGRDYARDQIEPT